jgi:hypothetical protein
MDRLIDTVQRQAGISRDQAQMAVTAIIGFFKAQLPSPLVGRIQAFLENDRALPEDDPRDPEAGPE